MHLGEESEEDRSRDGCTVNGDMRATGTTKDEVQDRTGWRRIVFDFHASWTLHLSSFHSEKLHRMISSCPDASPL